MIPAPRSADRRPAAPGGVEAPRFALAPDPHLVQRAVREGNGPLLVTEWHDIAGERPWAGLPRRLQSAVVQESPATVYCRAMAASAGLEIVSSESARWLQRRLMQANAPAAPLDIVI